MSHSENPSTVLVLGAQGRFGAAAVRAFAEAGWRVVAQARRPLPETPPGVQPALVPLDDTDGLVEAARGARAVVHAINPVYRRWADEVLPLGRLGMDVAARLGALFMLPGNVYNYGRGLPPLLGPGTPGRDLTAKGRIRAALEDEMRARARLASVVLRAGDFFGCGAGSWFDLVIAKSLAAGKIVYPGSLDVPHAWAYVPDLARAFVAVAERGLEAPFTDLGFAGHTLTGAELVAGIERAARARGLAPPRGFRTAAFPWGLIRAGGLFVPMWRELAEMRYLWERPHAVDGGALEALVGPLPSTPLPEALDAALAGLGVRSLR